MESNSFMCVSVSVLCVCVCVKRKRERERERERKRDTYELHTCTMHTCAQKRTNTQIHKHTHVYTRAPGPHSIKRTRCTPAALHNRSSSPKRTAVSTALVPSFLSAPTHVILKEACTEESVWLRGYICEHLTLTNNSTAVCAHQVSFLCYAVSMAMT
jgi:hypothetical protein